VVEHWLGCCSAGQAGQPAIVGSRAGQEGWERGELGGILLSVPYPLPFIIVIKVGKSLVIM
jgi:hypothetical protein